MDISHFNTGAHLKSTHYLKVMASVHVVGIPKRELDVKQRWISLCKFIIRCKWVEELTNTVIYIFEQIGFGDMPDSGNNGISKAPIPEALCLRRGRCIARTLGSHEHHTFQKETYLNKPYVGPST
jgi:hypothetical protein